MLKTLCVTVVFFALIGQSAQECSDRHGKIMFNNYGPLTCPDLVDATPGLCVSEALREACCSSCERKKSSDPTCPYGDVPEVTVRPENGGRDTTMPCPDAIQTGLSCNQIQWMCCATCKTLETGDPDCPYQDTPVGIYNPRGEIEAKNCSEYSGGRTCTKDDFKKRCCNTCKSKETGDADCPYGDVVGPVFNVANWGLGTKLYTCTELVAKSPQWCDRGTVRRDCCATCKNHPAGKRNVEEFEEADVLDIAEPTLVDWIVPEVVVVE